MIFKDPEEGLSFYKAYANAAGFTSRKSTTSRKKNNKDIIAFQYGVCNKEGFRATKKPIAQQTVDEEGKVRITRKRLVTRVGCNAHICMRYDAGKYVVSHFKEEHNHCLYTPSCAKFQKDNRKMHIMHKKLIVDNSKVIYFYVPNIVLIVMIYYVLKLILNHSNFFLYTSKCWSREVLYYDERISWIT